MSPDGPHLGKKKNFVFRKKMSGVFMSTTYSPRYEFVITKFLTQIRIYRVYTEDEDRSSWPRNFPVLFSTHPSLGYGFSALIFFPLVLSSGSKEKTLCADDYWDYKVSSPLPLLLETETAGPTKGTRTLGLLCISRGSA